MRFQVVEDGASRKTYTDNMFKKADGSVKFCSSVYRLKNVGPGIFEMDYSKDKLNFSNMVGDANGDRRFDVTRDITDKPTIVCEVKHNLDEEETLEIQFLNIGTDEIEAIGGKTYQIKDFLKSAGFKWNKSCRRWERDQ